MNNMLYFPTEDIVINMDNVVTLDIYNTCLNCTVLSRTGRERYSYDLNNPDRAKRAIESYYERICR